MTTKQLLKQQFRILNKLMGLQVQLEVAQYERDAEAKTTELGDRFGALLNELHATLNRIRKTRP